jgi:tetratricopeptide (TPR) repeat protein
MNQVKSRLSKAYNKLLKNLKTKVNSDNLLILCLCLLIFILFANYLNFQPKNRKTINAVKNFPLSSQTHLNLAELYFQNNNFNQAKQEWQLANSLYQKFYWLDFKMKTAERLNAVNLLLQKPVVINKEVLYWQKVLQNKSGGRDIYLRLAVLNHILWQQTEAEKYWQQAFYLDPNNPKVLLVQKLIKS